MNNMTTTEMINASIANERALEPNNGMGLPRTPEMRVLSNLRNACEIFAIKTYEDIKLIHKNSEERGLSAELLPHEVGEPFAMKILTYYIAGRIITTLSNANGDYVSLCGGEESIAGLHAINCDPNIALDMLEMLTRNWYLVYDKRMKVDKFKSDKNISLV